MLKLTRKEEWLQKQQDIEAIKCSGATLVFTLNTRRFLNKSILSDLVLEFERRLNKKLFGKAWRYKNKKLGWWHRLEFQSNNSHSHSVCTVNYDITKTEVKRAARRIWVPLNKKMGNENAQLWINAITKLNDEAVAVYVTKGDVTLSASA
jgi:hypothetical protein